MFHKAEKMPLTPEQEEANKIRKELDGLSPKAYDFLVEDEKNFRKKIEEEKNQSKLDPLTGLFNRGALFSEGQKFVVEARKKGEDCAIVMLDYDNFKRVNDTYGHQVGDKALKELAGIFKEKIPAPGFGARYGGDEFSIFLPNMDKNEAARIAEEIRAAVEKVIIKDADREIANTVSAGCASLKQVGTSAGEGVLDLIIDLADKALYSTKDEGKNRVTIYSEDLKKGE